MKEELFIDVELMHELFTYSNGNLYWKKSPVWSVKAGDRAGYYNPQDRYRSVRVNFVLYKEHRIIWAMHFGQISKGLQIDHINNIRNDNRIENLRLATISQNRINGFARVNNKSGHKGVYWSKHRKKWIARIQKDYKTHTIGAFEDIGDAANAYNAASKRLYGEYAKTAIEL